MPRPVQIDDQRLLRVARKLFLAKGLKATTAEIARGAGIAQGSIFRRFKTKEDLFRTAMLSESFPWMGALQQRTEAVGLEQALVETGIEVVAMYRKALPIMWTAWSNRGAVEGLKAEMPLAPKPVEELFQFFGEQVKAGRIRRVDPRLLTASYLGALMSYATISLVRGKHPVEPRPYVRGFMQLLWSGIAPERG
jgi:AcrR family transcriptional regulator